MAAKRSHRVLARKAAALPSPENRQFVWVEAFVLVFVFVEPIGCFTLNH
jgi:hypothetical protein